MNKTRKDEQRNTIIAQTEGEAPPLVEVSERDSSGAASSVALDCAGPRRGVGELLEDLEGLDTEELSKIVEARLKGTDNVIPNTGVDVSGAAPLEPEDTSASVVSTHNLEEGCAGWDDIIQKATTPTVAETPGPNCGQQSSHALAIGVVETIPGAYAVAPENAVTDNTTTQNTGSQSPPEQEEDMASLMVPGLVSAFPVPVAEPLPLAQEVDVGEETAHEVERKARAKRLTYICASLSLIILLTLPLLLVCLVPENASKETDKVNDEDGLTRETEFQLAQSNLIKVLPSYTVDAIESSYNSPQSLAYQWLRNDTALASYPEWRLIQRFALATFFYATEGPKRWKNTTHWLSYDHHECDWFAQSYPGCKDMMAVLILSVYTHLYWSSLCATLNCVDVVAGATVTDIPFSCEDDPNGAYKHVWLWSHGLQGGLPKEFYLLTSLKSVSIYDNDLSGAPFPSLIGQLTSMLGFNIGLAKLKGSLPSEVGLMTSMKYLALTDNSLTGSIPSEIGGLSNLELAILSKNQLNSTIPSIIGRLTNLYLLMFEKNQLTGPIPSQLESVSQAAVVDISENNLTSTIPTELGNLKSVNRLLLDHNTLTGTVPSQLGQLSTLKDLQLDHNNLASTIPTELGNITPLWTLSADSNELTGPIPSELGNLSLLEKLYLQSNDFTGTVPEEIGILATNSSLWVFNVTDTLLSGTIPSQFCNDTLYFGFDCVLGGLCGCDCMCYD